MSKILIVGNILKDVYLNLDTRTEKFESDADKTEWLDLSFNASQHHFYSRSSSFGGAVVSLEVFRKLGLEADIVGKKVDFDSDSKIVDGMTDIYRYILIADDDQVTYFTPSQDHATDFVIPEEKYDYIYIDRSAELTEKNVGLIEKYLESSPKTYLILYTKDADNSLMRRLFSKAVLIFTEQDLKFVNSRKIVKIKKDRFSYMDISKDFVVNRADVATHLSTHSIIAATILGGFISGYPVDKSLELARINAEYSKINTSLSLVEIENLMEDSGTKEVLEMIAKSLLIRGKGILAADESGGSIEKKFAQLNIPDTYQNRRDYRNLFFTTPDLEKYVSGVILFDETARQFSDDGRNFVDFLTARRIIPGIKVDQGLEKFPDSEETWTKGLDGLSERLSEYYKMGLRFAKWRAAFNLTETTPSDMAIQKNAEILAQYAADCQKNGIVPIIEPELVYDGYYSVERCSEVTGKILDVLFNELKKKDIVLPACILKVNMVLAGKKFGRQSTTEEVGKETAKVLKEHVPEELAGVVFLSGGQTVEQATDNLSEVIKNGPFPWPVTFSFARALQDPALFAWKGDNANQEVAKKAFQERLIANTNALQ